MSWIPNTGCKEEIWQRFTQQIRAKPAGAKIRENASSHFQSQSEEVSGQLLADFYVDFNCCFSQV
jgi:hypothetical protein